MPYSKTTWVNDATPAMSAVNLNKLTNELESQAAAIGLAHTLPNWADGVAPAVSDQAPLNEMERVIDLVAADQGLSYTPTVWAAGWSPARNAINLNKMENQAASNRAALESGPPASLNDQAGLLVYNYGGSSGTLSGLGGDSTKFRYLATIVFSAHQVANIANFVAYNGVKGRALCYKTISETAATNGATTWAGVPTTQTVAADTRRNLTGAVPADEVKYHDANNLADQWMLWSAAGLPLYYGQYTQSFIVDPASVSYQARAYTYLLDQITSRGYDGIWSDNVLVTTLVNGGYPFYRRNAQNQLVVAYADPAAYSNAMVSCVAATLGRLKDDGYYSGANCNYWIAGDGQYNTGVGQNAWITRVAPYLSNVTFEYCSYAATAPASRSTENVQWYDYWTAFTETARTIAAGAGAAHSQGLGTVGSEQAKRYGVGTARTHWNGGEPATSVAWGSPWWTPSVDEFVWGNAVGSLMTSGTLRARRWTNGWAVINTGRTAASATFPDPLLGGTRPFTIQPVDAYLGA